MTNQHPFTPPPELVQQWIKDCDNPEKPRWQEYEQDIATLAAQWGADQELEACINYFCEYDTSFGENSELITGLRSTRRPKPPSLKEEALLAIDTAVADGRLSPDISSILRRALEAIDD